jgi:hypothetical protein
MKGACSTHGRDEKCIQHLVERPEEKPRCKWENDIRTDVAQDKDQWRARVNTVMNVRVP